MVEILSAAGPSVVNSCDEEGWAPLHSAASSGNVRIVEILLNSGEYLRLFLFNCLCLLLDLYDFSLEESFGWSQRVKVHPLFE